MLTMITKTMTTIRKLFLAWNLYIILLQLLYLPRHHDTSSSFNGLLLLCFAQGTVDFSCDPFVTTCPTENNGICESEIVAAIDPNNFVEDCQRSDCGDCLNYCLELSFDCEACIQSGCYWCPGDARCYNIDLYDFDKEESSCTSPRDYLHKLTTGNDSCKADTTDNHFK